MVLFYITLLVVKLKDTNRKVSEASFFYIILSVQKCVTAKRFFPLERNFELWNAENQSKLKFNLYSSSTRETWFHSEKRFVLNLEAFQISQKWHSYIEKKAENFNFC